jgi:hypothetical protein
VCEARVCGNMHGRHPHASLRWPLKDSARDPRWAVQLWPKAVPSERVLIVAKERRKATTGTDKRRCVREIDQLMLGFTGKMSIRNMEWKKNFNSEFGTWNDAAHCGLLGT